MSQTLESFHLGITIKIQKFRELTDVLYKLRETGVTNKSINDIDFDNQHEYINKNKRDLDSDLEIDNIFDVLALYNDDEILSQPNTKIYSNARSNIEVSKDKIDELLARLNYIEDLYNTNTTDCFNDYYQDIDAKEAENTYFLNLTTINIESKVRELITQCNKVISLLGAYDDTKVLKLMNIIEHNDISIPVEPIDYEICCQTKMETFSNVSQLYCSRCGKIVDIKGMVFEDAQFYSQEGKKTKHGRYERIKTFHKWMDNILARGKVKISKTDLDKISTCIERDGMGKMGKAPTLTLRHIRAYLQELDITNYNCNASYLLATFSGVYPPQLTVSEYNKITIYYKKVIDMYSKDLVGSNTRYCPYFIYKIIEEIWPADKIKLQLLNYIHLKKPNTLMKWDNEWRKICIKHGFIFRATDYTKFDDF